MPNSSWWWYLCKNLCESENKERDVVHASELCAEGFDLCVESFSRGVRAAAGEVV